VSDYDVLVIGAGPGGYPAAIRASQLGLKVACVEKEKLGGVCLNWGCIPSKALLKTAELVAKVRHAEDWGLKVPTLEIDFPAVIARSRTVAKRHEKGVGGLFKKYGVTHLTGEAVITGKGEVSIDGKTVTADHIVIATGASARTFPGMEPDGDRILTYREAIVRDTPVSSATILGAGAIGLEFAYFWHHMGAEVTVIEGASEILPREDSEVAAAARKSMTKQGIRFEIGTFVDHVKAEGKGTRVTMKDGRTFDADITLLALGIRPNTAGIGLETVGITVERGLVPVDGQMRTNVPGFYAVGDITPSGGLAHTATRQAELCVERIAGHGGPDFDATNIPSCTYCQPQVASIGLTEAAAKEQGIAYRVGTFPFLANGKAQGAQAAEGFVKVLLGEPHGQIVGAHIVGAEATELIGEFTLARTNELTADEILATIHAHPTYTEALFEAVAQAYGQTVHM
jgi:dihydrolipoamide dehydrogenase